MIDKIKQALISFWRILMKKFSSLLNLQLSRPPTQEEQTVATYNFPIPTSGLKRLYDPRDIESTQIVSEWDTPSAESGKIKAFSATAPPGSEPSYLTNRINGEPSVYFDGADKVLLEQQPVPFASADTAASFYIVSKADISQQSSILSTTPNDNNNRINIHLPYFFDENELAIFDYGDRNNGGRALAGWGSSFGEWYLWEFRVQSGSMEIIRNGQTIEESQESSTSPVNFSNGEVFQIGRFLTDQYFEGELAFMAMYNRYVDGQDRTDILDYIESRFGLAIDTSGPTQLAPTVDTFTQTEQDSQVTFGWNVDEQNSSLVSIELEIDGVFETLSTTDPTGTYIKTGLTNDQSYDARMRFTNGIGDVTTDLVSVTPAATTELPPPPALATKFINFWDGQEYEADTGLIFGNMVQTQGVSTTLSQVNDTGNDAIIAGFVFKSLDSLQNTNPAATQQDAIDGWRAILQSRKSAIHAVGKDRTLFILLQDEPYGTTHGFTRWETEELIRQAKDILHTDGQAFYYGYTEPFGPMLGWSGGWDPADNADYFSITYYPVQTDLPGWENEGTYKRKLRDSVQGFKNQSNNPNMRMWFIIQGFSATEAGAEWTDPPDELPLWTRDVLLEEGITEICDGICVYEWKDRAKTNSLGVNNRPGYFANMEAVLTDLESA